MTGYEVFREVAQWITVMIMLGVCVYAGIATHGMRKEWDEVHDHFDNALGNVHKRLDRMGAPGPVPERADTDVIVITDLDRPTPDQQAAPTRPDLTSQRPTPGPRTNPIPLAAGTGGRHRHRADS